MRNVREHTAHGRSAKRSTLLSKRFIRLSSNSVHALLSTAFRTMLNSVCIGGIVFFTGYSKFHAFHNFKNYSNYSKLFNLIFKKFHKFQSALDSKRYVRLFYLFSFKLLLI